MKKSKWNNCIGRSGLLLAAVIVIAGCTANKVIVKPSESQKIMHFSDLKNWDQTKSLNNYVLYLNAGETFPLALTMETDFMAFKQDHIDIVARQKLYLRIEMPETLSTAELAKMYRLDARRFSEMSEDQKMALFKDFRLYLSKDTVHWAPLYSPAAIKKVLGFKGATIALGMMASITDGLGASLVLKTVK